MDSDCHFRTSSTNTTTSASSELFICFTSRFSSSSAMKISSKSILSPGRTREPSQISLSTSLSRRLRTSGSLKGGQASPMFPTNGKKRGCAFENPEPSSPKVTCIGQVRVKTKKQGKKMRARSQKRRSSEPSFRKSEQIQISNEQQFVAHLQIQNSQECLSHRNQKWVHLPFTICEALRTFGAELNCFLPCHSSCAAANDREKDEKPARSPESERSCGAVFARWLVAVQDGDGKEREIELVVGDEETKPQTEMGSRRRHVFEGLEFKETDEVVEQEESRIGICIPPKNALLLMRCRSDPVKVAELAKRFCESPKMEEDEEDGETVIKDEEEEKRDELNLKLNDNGGMSEESVSDGEEEKVEVEDEVNNGEEAIETKIITVNQSGEEEEGNDDNQQELAEETIEILTSCVSDVVIDSEKVEEDDIEVDECKSLPGNEPEPEPEPEEDEQHGPKLSEEEGDVDNGGVDERLATKPKPTSPSPSVHSEPEPDEAETEEEENLAEMSWEDEEKATHEGSEPENGETGPDQSKEREIPPEPDRETSVLPDCLLLMMYEPKLSMEVSKETWVSSTDFSRCIPTREKKTVEKSNGGDPPKKRVSIDSKPPEIPQPVIQPARWSCSFPAPAVAAARSSGVSMATMIEQKLVSAKAYEPFVLTRCKSEPMRSSAKLAPVLAPVPDACFWKDRKLEPHRPATFGVGAAGVGF